MSVKNKQEVIKAVKATGKAAGTNLIGNIVFWRVSEVEISVADLEAMFDEVGLDRKWMPIPISPRRAFWKAYGLANREAKGYMIRTILDKKGETHVIGIVKEDKDEDKIDLEYGVECKVTFEDKAGTVKCDRKHPVGDLVLEHFKELKDTFITLDITEMLAMHIGGRSSRGEGMESIMLRPGGGVLFVPQTYAAEIAKYQAIIAQLGDSELTAIPVYDTPQTQANMAGVARRSLEEDLKELLNQVKEYEEVPPRRDALKRRIDDFKALQTKAGMYQSLLTLKSEDLTSAMAKAQAKLEELLGIEEAKAEKPKATQQTVEKIQRIRIVRKVAQIGVANLEKALKNTKETKDAKPATIKKEKVVRASQPPVKPVAKTPVRKGARGK